jgi:hypothetical protein
MNYRNQDYKNIQNTLQPMINLDEIFKGHKVSAIIAAVGGWIYNLFLLDIRTFSWDFLIKGVSGIVFAAASAFIVVATKDFYQIKVKPKLFKNETKNKKATKTDDEAA